MADFFKVSFDKWGIYLSGLCAAHCLFVPVSLALLPSYSHLFTSEWVHLAILALVLPLALLAIWRGYRRHQARQVLVFGSAGVSLLILGVLLEAWSGAWEFSLTLLGSLILISAHVMNLRRSHKTDCNHDVKAVY